MGQLYWNCDIPLIHCWYWLLSILGSITLASFGLTHTYYSGAWLLALLKAPYLLWSRQNLIAVDLIEAVERFLGDSGGSKHRWLVERTTVTETLSPRWAVACWADQNFLPMWLVRMMSAFLGHQRFKLRKCVIRAVPCMFELQGRVLTVSASEELCVWVRRTQGQETSACARCAEDLTQVSVWYVYSAGSKSSCQGGWLLIIMMADYLR